MSELRDSTRVPLDRAELIEISGADTLGFAHAQFASDVAGLAPACWQWSSWLTPQGRTRCVFALLRIAPDRLLLWLPLGGAATLRGALARFVLRAKVQLVAHENGALCSSAAENFLLERPRELAEHDGGYAIAMPGTPARIAWLGLAAGAPPNPGARDAWRLADVESGLPWIAPATQDEFVPQSLDLERLDAIRFDKGCFPGQEIAARLHFLGGVKQHLYRMAMTGDADAPSGLHIESATVRAGVVLYSAPASTGRCSALAVLSDAAVEAAPLKSAAGHLIEDVRRV